MRCDLNNYEYHLPPKTPEMKWPETMWLPQTMMDPLLTFKMLNTHPCTFPTCMAVRERENERERERGDFLMPEMASQQFSQSELARSLSPVSKRNANWPPAVYFSQWNDVFVSCSSPAVSRLANSSRMPTFRKRTLWCRRRPNPVSN